ncbi:MAG TPA: MHYT domain-containing protein [Terriglobales bacterium]|nr:MHYT domain-containing protein [Terriglobales bacterium]
MVPAQSLSYSYNFGLVGLSIVIAAMASYAAFNLAGRIAAYKDNRRFGWLAGGAAAMGIGIWSMHYTGMLAFNLPVAVAYQVPMVLLSLAAAVVGAAVALLIVAGDKLSLQQLSWGGLAMGAAIGAMHYIGMAAMRGQMMHHYSAGLVVLSLLVAVAFSCLALWLMFYFRKPQHASAWLKLLAAIVMGSGIASMHYTAMAAVTFTPSDMGMRASHTVSVSELALAGIVAATLLVLGAALLTSWLDRRLSLERLYRLVLESVDVVLWRADAQTLRLNFLSSGAERVFGGNLALDERAPLWTRRIHPEDVQRVQSCYESAAGTNEALQLDYRLIKADGQTVWLREIVRSISKPRAKQLIGVTRDVTDSKRLEQALVTEEKLAALGRLSATIAHEINNPLQAAMNLIYAVSQKTTDPGDLGYLSLAGQELRHAAEIAKRTLGFYKNGNVTSKVEFGRVLNDLAFLYEPRLRNKGVTLSTWSADNAVLLGSDSEMRQILSNLLSNSLDAVAENGNIKMRVSCSRGWRNGQKPGIRITVVDDGQGIGADIKDRVFLPFFTTKADVGTGLGLWVVKQLTEKYQGYITIRSTQNPPRRGTAVSVFLPSNVEIAQRTAAMR